MCKYDFVTLDLILKTLLLSLKGISIGKTYMGKLSYTTKVELFYEKKTEVENLVSGSL
jgi:hypothetical protein